MPFVLYTRYYKCITFFHLFSFSSNISPKWYCTSTRLWSYNIYIYTCGDLYISEQKLAIGTHPSNELSIHSHTQIIYNIWSFRDVRDAHCTRVTHTRAAVWLQNAFFRIYIYNFFFWLYKYIYYISCVPIVYVCGTTEFIVNCGCGKIM